MSNIIIDNSYFVGEIILNKQFMYSLFSFARLDNYSVKVIMKERFCQQVTTIGYSERIIYFDNTLIYPATMGLKDTEGWFPVIDSREPVVTLYRLKVDNS